MDIQNTIKEGQWIIAHLTYKGVDCWTVSKEVGRFTFYIHGPMEKVFFVYSLEQIQEAMEKEPNTKFFFAYGHQMGFWVEKQDVNILLKHIVLTEKEKQIKETLKSDKATTTYTYH